MSYSIEVKNLSKKYSIAKSKDQYSNFCDKIINFSKKYKVGYKKKEEFFALKNINFNINFGEVVGIIGSNGAGKSTLLKVLSKITQPTSGSIKINGKITSLLEVGTGFHPELSGHDNIFLNGAILGMSKKEIEKKFDKIVEFSGISKFIDTPIKYYSSGMSVRLAFSISVNLESEILLLDEVLSVGDIKFQKKSQEKIRELTENMNRSIIFVSHNMTSIRHLCNRCILLKQGKIQIIGDTKKVIDFYLQSKKDDKIYSFSHLKEKIDNLPKDSIFKLKKIELTQNNKLVFSDVVNSSPIKILIKFQIYKKIVGLRIFINLYDFDDNLVFRSFHDECNNEISVMEPGNYSSIAIIPTNLLGPISYKLCVNASICNDRNLLPISGICIPFNVNRTDEYNRAYCEEAFCGKIILPINWNTKK